MQQIVGVLEFEVKKLRTKVAIVLPYFGEAGAETMVSRIASHMDLARIDLEVICIYGEPLNNRLEKAVLDHGVPIKYIGKGLGFSLKATQKLWQELSRFKPDVVHTHLSAGVYVAPWILCHKVKQLHTLHTMPIYEFGKIKTLVMRGAYFLGKAVPVGISKEIKRMTDEFYVLKHETELIYNPVDVSRYAHAYHKTTSTFTIINVGRLSTEKNQRMLIDVVSELTSEGENIKLEILGDGPLREELEMSIHNKGLDHRIILHGKVPNVEDYLGQADAFVLSSIYEGLPLVILEAMAAGLPVITTNVGGIKDIVQDNGILVEAGNVEAFKKAVKDLLHDTNMRIIMGHRSEQIVERFDSHEIANQYMKLYQKYS